MNNPITTIVTLAALTAKRKTLTERIARYTDYVRNDKMLCAKSEKHARKYGNRLRNHEAKLARFMESLLRVEDALEKALNA